MTPTVMTTLMLPDHTNPAGNVHGGETMKLLEAAGYIAAARHMKNIPIAADTRPANAKWELRTARVESLHFIAPAFVGDVVTVEARVVFASPRSMAVGCRVMAETVSKGDAPRDTNTALLWYVCKLKGGGEDNDRDVAMVPAVVDDHDSATWSERATTARARTALSGRTPSRRAAWRRASPPRLGAKRATAPQRSEAARAANRGATT